MERHQALPRSFGSVDSDACSLASVADDDLLERLARLLRHSRRLETDLIAHIAEVDARRLFRREACPSMFAYCTELLHFSEPEAYLRITVARASREHPSLLAMLADGRLHLSGVALIAPHLTPGNRDAVLARAAGKTKREIEELVAELVPRPDATSSIRRLPERTPSLPATGWADSTCRGGTAAATSGNAVATVASPCAEPIVVPDAGAAFVPDVGVSLLPASASCPGAARELRPDGVASSRIQPIAPGRYRVQFTASGELRDKLERLVALMRDSATGGDLAVAVEAAVTEKLQRLEARRFGLGRGRADAPAAAPESATAEAATAAAATAEAAATTPATETPRAERVVPGSRASATERARGMRHVPAAVRRAVFVRDGGRCRYTDERGRRCTARAGLEFHHRHPLGYGGTHEVDNICLMCRAHNAYLAEVDYGRHSFRTESGAGSVDHATGPPA